MAPPPASFTCNVCGTLNPPLPSPADYEASTCRHCRSSIRLRAIVLALSRGLFGLDLPLPDFPRLKSLRGLGISDSDIYADRLERHFSYVNTFFHREPRLDITAPDPRLPQHDFLLCSDVLEHIPGDPTPAFDNLRALLKPTGVMVFSVPFSLDDATRENFEPGACGLATIDGRLVLVSRGEAGYRVYDQLVFHGGQGSTLEHRLFSESDLKVRLAAAGFRSVEILSEGSEDFGVRFSGPCSLPMLAYPEQFSLNRSAAAELLVENRRLSRLLASAADSRWLRLGRRLALGPHLKTPSA